MAVDDLTIFPEACPQKGDFFMFCFEIINNGNLWRLRYVC